MTALDTLTTDLSKLRETRADAIQRLADATDAMYRAQIDFATARNQAFNGRRADVDGARMVMDRFTQRVEQIRDELRGLDKAIDALLRDELRALLDPLRKERAAIQKRLAKACDELDKDLSSVDAYRALVRVWEEDAAMCWKMQRLEQERVGAHGIKTPRLPDPPAALRMRLKNVECCALGLEVFRNTDVPSMRAAFGLD